MFATCFLVLKLKADANSECWLDCADAQAGQYINTFCHFYDDTRCRYSYVGSYNITDSVVHAWIQRGSKSTLTTFIFILLFLFLFGSCGEREREDPIATKTGHHRSAS